MPFSPQSADIQQSLALLKTRQAVTQDDFFHISWNFVFHPEQDRFLLEVHADNEKLAESLLVFRNKLEAAKAEEEALLRVFETVFHHYIVNTQGIILEEETADPFDVFAAATQYANTISVGVSKAADGESKLQLDGKEIVCPQWGIQPGWSAAWSLRKVGPVINRVRYGRDDVIPSSVFGFDENADWHNLPNAMKLADFAHLAYFGPAYIQQQLKQWGYTTFHWIEDQKTDTQAFATSKENHTVVCYRGTASKKDWMIDAKLGKKKSFNEQGKVHSGFKGALDSVWQQVQDAVNDLGGDKKIFITGHSLGAALAQLTGYRLAVLDRPPLAIYAYGSPRVGNRAFKKAYDELLSDNTFLHINHKDIVTQLPPKILGYRHLGPEPRVFDDGHNLSEPSPFERALPDTGEEKEFEELDEETQKEIEWQMLRMKNALEASTEFLNTPPELLETGNYESTFEGGRIDDHSMHQYLFKLGCAIIDGEWKRISAT